MKISVIIFWNDFRI